MPDVLTRKYFIYILYHDAIEPENMGYYHLHVWTPLHFLLHLALLLTVEGAPTLILWNTSKRFAIEWSHLFAKNPMPWTPGFVSNNDLCNSLSSSIVALNNSLKTNLMYDDYGKDLRAIGKLNFNTSNYTVYFEAQNLTEKIYTGIETAIFQTFFSSAPESGNSTVSIKHKHYDTRLIDAKLGDISTTVETAIASFYLGAGLFLVLLAVLYCMSMGKKNREEWAATALRVVAGIGVTCTILAIYVLPFSGYGFLRSVWLIPIVMLGYFIGMRELGFCGAIC